MFDSINKDNPESIGEILKFFEIKYGPAFTDHHSFNNNNN